MRNRQAGMNCKPKGAMPAMLLTLAIFLSALTASVSPAAGDSVQSSCPEAAEESAPKKSSSMTRQGHVGGIAGGIVLLSSTPAGLFAMMGSINFFGDFHLKGPFYLTAEVALYLYREKHEGLYEDTLSWVFPVRASLGGKYFWSWERSYLYLGIDLSAGFFYYDDDSYGYYDMIKGLLIGGGILFGYGIRLTDRISFFMEPCWIIAGLFGEERAVVSGGAFTAGVRLGL
jgi:hypothetical protein